MKALRIDHTAIAVHDLREAIPRYERLYGVTCTEQADVPDQRVAIAFLAVGGTQLELIQPTDRSSGVARFLERRGEALHHIAWLVDDIEKALSELAGQGLDLIDLEPRRGPHGLVAFVHPRGTGGVLIELVQHTEMDILQA